ncbi:hypothetical protein NDA14_006373 [Ustilago hordei]|nr:hypothetical protein NDA14_006373 [Ustilago hordei]
MNDTDYLLFAVLSVYGIAAAAKSSKSPSSAGRSRSSSAGRSRSSSAGRSRSSSAGRSRSSSSSALDFWLTAYIIDTSSSDWPQTPVTMEEFGIHNIATMWQNRPAKAHAAVCINSPWNVKNYDNVSPAMSVAYFNQKFWTKKVFIWDCVYIWGPDQQFYSFDDVKSDRMAWAFDDTKCSMDNVTMDLSCL